MIDPRPTLIAGRVDAESIMTDEVVVWRASATRAAQRVDDQTGEALDVQEVIADATTTGSDGRSLAGPQSLGLKCWVRSPSDTAGDTSATTAEQWVTVRVHVPWDAPKIREGDTIHVVRSESASLQGADIVVLSPITRTRQVAARYLGEIPTEAE